MRTVFVTHNDLGLACLEELVGAGIDVRAVYTRPLESEIADRTNLGGFTDRNDIALHRVESVNSAAVKRQISEYDPQLLFVVGWSRLVEQAVIDIPTDAAIGMHPAPLPRGRGRAPIAWALIKGLDETALSMFHLTERADAGDLIGQEPIPIDPDDDASALYDKVVDAGRELVRTHIEAFQGGEIPRTPQDESAATWWPRRRPHHGLIDWRQSPSEIYDWIRAQSDPYPGAFSYLAGDKVTIWEAEPPNETRQFVSPGEITHRDGDALGVGAWEGIVEVTELQVENDGRIPAGELLTRDDYEIGDTFENAHDRLMKDR